MFFEILMLLWLSHYRVIGKEVLKPNSFSNLRSEMVSQVHLAKALYSNSHEDLEVEFYFLEDQEIGVDPLVNK